MSKKQKRALIELVLGLLGVSTPDIFREVFKAIWNEGNKYAIIGWIVAIIISIISLADGTATLAGYKNLGGLIFQDENE